MNQRSVVRFFLVGLPVGLAVSIVVAVYLYYHPIDFRLPGRAALPQATDLIRKSPTEKDLLEYRRILSVELPDRSTGSPAATIAAANWLGSTLGPTNIGLPVRTQDLAPDATSGRNVVVELPGSKSAGEVIVVCTAYDGKDSRLNSSSGTAMLMTVANAFVGLPQQRSLVFAFLCHDQPPAGQRSGAEALLAALRGARHTVRGVIDVRVLTVPEVPGGSPPRMARIDGCPEPANDPWATEAWEALVARRPPTASAGRIERAALDPGGSPLLSLLPWWSQPAPPAPFLIVALRPTAPGDTDSLLALARSLEGMIQSLANR